MPLWGSESQLYFLGDGRKIFFRSFRSWAIALTRSTSAGSIPLADWGRTQSLPVPHHMEAGCFSLSPAREKYLYLRHTFPSLIEKPLAANIRSDSVATESRIMEGIYVYSRYEEVLWTNRRRSWSYRGQSHTYIPGIRFSNVKESFWP
jgi:hypothetical protein